MKKNSSSWGRLPISRKFKLAFATQLLLTLFIAATTYFSFLSIKNAEEDIRKSTEVRLQVLEIDRGMERSHRLLSDFFLNHRSIGLQKAHEEYAQPSVRQTAQLISLSSLLLRRVSTTN